MSDEAGSDPPLKGSPDALARVVRLLASDANTVPDEALSAAVGLLVRYSRNKFENISADEAHDISVDVLLRLADRVGGEEWEPPSDAYILASVKNAGIDLLRRRAAASRRETSLAELPDFAADDVVSASFEAAETAESVRKVLRKARADGDQVTFRVVTAALNATERLGQRPSNRRLALELGLSHTAVNKALTRFRTYLADA